MNTTQFYLVFHTNEQEWTELSKKTVQICTNQHLLCGTFHLHSYCLLVHSHDAPVSPTCTNDLVYTKNKPEYSKNTVRMTRMQYISCSTNTIATRCQCVKQEWTLVSMNHIGLHNRSYQHNKVTTGVYGRWRWDITKQTGHTGTQEHRKSGTSRQHNSNKERRP